MDHEPQLVANEQCQVGENPLWDERRGRLYWTDIPTGRLFCWDAATCRQRKSYHDAPVGGFTLQEDGSLLLFRVNEIALRTDDGNVRVLRRDVDPEMERFNDVIADPEGRVFAGTIGKNERGGLFRIDPDGSIRCLFRGTSCSNGMGFAPDLRHFYWTCTTSRRIYRFTYDRASGELSDRQVLVQVVPGEGVPDGLAVDAEGNLWSARWGGSAVHHYAADGRPLAKVKFPVARVSSATFGGPALDTLFVTTAGGSGNSDGPPDGSQDGAVFSVTGAARGRAPFRSRVSVS